MRKKGPAQTLDGGRFVFEVDEAAEPVDEDAAASSLCGLLLALGGGENVTAELEAGKLAC